MCGIAGIIQTHTYDYSIEHVKKMTNAIAHRGPDGEGSWQDEKGNVFFGHRRLSILDLSEAAAQPFRYMDRYIVLHNGEIYNYIELRQELRSKGYQFRTQTDTEVLGAAYDCWKKDCVHRFDGMFAFAIWDRQQKIFFAARDRFGEKPFYYIYNPTREAFFFASEIKAFWPVGLGREFNKKMLFNFLTIGYTDNPNRPEETFYLDVNKLPPASYLEIKFQPGILLQIDRYWDIDLENQDDSITGKDAIEKFSELLTTSIKRRLRSDVPLGTSLSGGLDSSSIAATITRIKDSTKASNGPRDTLQTFSVIFPGFVKNEEKYIDDVARHLSIRSFKTMVGDAEIPELFHKVIRCQDEPFGSAGTLPQYKVFELAKQNDVKVLLDGQGADETLAGYSKYYKWYWQELFRNRKLIQSKELKRASQLGVQESFGFKNIVSALFPEFASVFLERQYLLRALQQEDLTRDFVRFQSEEAYYTAPTIFSLNGVLYFNTRMHGLEELLRYADRDSMAHGREVRLPFLSHELVEFVFSLPSSFKIREGWTKWILRKAEENDLPGEIAWRKEKIGLEPPQWTWMQLPPVLEMIRAAKAKLVNEKILKPAVLRKNVQPSSAYDKNNLDWKYLVSAQFLHSSFP